MISREWICKNVDFTKYINQRAAVKQSMSVNYTVGLYTDDTEMTVAAIHALLSHKPLTEQTLIEFFKAEFDKAKNWLGVLRQGHGSIKSYFLGYVC